MSPDRSPGGPLIVREPISVCDRVLRHPELWAWVGSVVVGLSLALGKVLSWWPSSSTLTILPLFSALTLAALLITGGALATWGVLTPPKSNDLNLTWLTERVGLVLLTGGWTIFVVMVAAYYTPNSLNVGLPLAVVFMAVTRIVASIVAERGLDAARKRAER